MTRALKLCQACGVAYERNRKHDIAQWAKSKFCSRECSRAYAKIENRIRRGSLQDRFNTLFLKGQGCWEWQGTIDGYGYGVIDHGGRRYRSHVLALEYDDRAVPKGGVACHHCDNPRCVRPSHLYPGTPADNVRDAQFRGRLAVGERSGTAKLTADQVRKMRSLALPFSEIAKRFNVSRTTAARVVKGTAWRHIA